ncbi:MAG: mechanosensitive ion channel family protein [Proteobacteria bacterium]|nr:mechanosensitive ion channel family protein [Pseudomonadota bacterium]
MLRDWLAPISAYFGWLPDWLASLLIFLCALLLALAVQRKLFQVLTRVVEDKDLFWRALVSRTHGPLRLGAIMLALIGAAAIAPLTEAQATATQRVLSLCLIVLIGWAVHSAIDIWMTLYLRRFKLEAADNLLARKHVTQTRILRRILNTIILIVTAAAAMMTFESVRQYGVSLLASAGAAGLVAGLALQPVLKNLFAGVQLAITQPIRIDDALLVEGEYGNVEEITSTYVVIRIWDWRRLIVPISYFLEQPFQNWTREGASLIGEIKLYVDYTADVTGIRNQATEIVKNSHLWDKDVINVAVTDLREKTMEIRILATASTSGQAFDLRCEIREKLIAYLQQSAPDALPRVRTSVAAPHPLNGDGRTVNAGPAA